MSEQAGELQVKLKELSVFYKLAKEKVLQAEKLIPKFPMQPFNEIRNCFDHIMRGIYNGNFSEVEYIEAKAHLKRAALDALEIIAVAKLDKFESDYRGMDVISIIQIHGDFFKDTVLEIDKRKNLLAQMRASKDDHPADELVEQYSAVVDELCEKIDGFYLLLPRIIEVQKKHRRSKRMRLIFEVLILGSLIAVGGAYAHLWMETHWFKPEQTITSPAVKSPAVKN